MDIYNKEELHSAIEYKTPDEVYFTGDNSYRYDTKELLLKVASWVEYIGLVDWS